MIFVLFIIVGLTSLGFFFPKSKLVFILITLQIMVVVGGYNGLGDLDNYRYRYEMGMITEEPFEKLYDLFALMFHTAGVPFELFHFIVSGASIFLIAWVVFHISHEPALTMSLTVGFTTLEYALQIKALCAAGIVAYALYFYCRDIGRRGPKDLKTNLIFAFLIVLATGFHFNSAFFFLFLIVGKVSARKMKRVVVVGVGLLFIAMPLTMQFASQYIGALGFYEGNYRSIGTLIGLLLWHLSGFMITLWVIKMARERAHDPKDERFLNFVSDGSWLMLLIIPFYSLTSVANRFVRVWSIFFYSSSSYSLGNKLNVTLSKLAMLAYSIGSFLLFYVILPSISSGGYNALTDVLANNLFW